MVQLAFEAQVSSPNTEAAADVESQILSAMRSRASHFKEQANSLTFEGVRRLLEKDMGLETYALDVHKKFIKQRLLEGSENVDDGNVSKSTLETVEKIVHTRKEKMKDSSEIEQPKKDVKEANSEDGVELDDSPVMGLLTGKDKSKAQTKDTEDIGKEGLPTESTVKDAVWKRASYLKTNSSEITMAGVRQLLEEDLGLDKKTLLPFKKFISEQIDLVLNPPKVSKPTSSAKKKNSDKSSRGKPAKHESSDESDDSLDSESEEEAKTMKKVAAKRKVSDEPKKRKIPAAGTKASNKKRLKVAGESGDAEGVSESDQSLSSEEKSAKKKEVDTPTYGRRVERLKSVIKSCGMSVPPVIYRKAKQVSEDKREAFLRKELEEILSREGLSADPSEKEIKDVKKRKERAKELEGIDMSNIVSNTRRRSTASFVPPPKPKITVETKDDDTENSSDEEGDSEDESDEGGDSQSEELNEDPDDDNSD